MKRRVNRISTHRDRHGIAYWRFHYVDGGYAMLSERYTKEALFQEIHMTWIRKFSAGMMIDMPEFEVDIKKGRTTDLVTNFRLPFQPETIERKFELKQRKLI